MTDNNSIYNEVEINKNNYENLINLYNRIIDFLELLHPNGHDLWSYGILVHKIVSYLSFFENHDVKQNFRRLLDVVRFNSLKRNLCFVEDQIKPFTEIQNNYNARKEIKNSFNGLNENYLNDVFVGMSKIYFDNIGNYTNTMMYDNYSNYFKYENNRETIYLNPWTMEKTNSLNQGEFEELPYYINSDFYLRSHEDFFPYDSQAITKSTLLDLLCPNCEKNLTDGDTVILFKHQNTITKKAEVISEIGITGDSGFMHLCYPSGGFFLSCGDAHEFGYCDVFQFA